MEYFLKDSYHTLLWRLGSAFSPVHDMKVSMGCWLLRLSAKILAHLRLSVNFFQLRLTKKVKN